MKDLLFVEDETAIANLFCPHLERAGWRTHWVTTVGAGTAAVLQRSYDAVLLDLVLKEDGHPDGDGLDVLRTLRTHGILTPVIIESAFGTERLARELGEEFGVVTVLAKPVARQTLLLCLAAAAAAAKTIHDPLAVAQEECALGDCSVVCGSDVCLGILLRAIGDRGLSLRSFAHLSEQIARLAVYRAQARARPCAAISGACELSGSAERELNKILSVLATSDVAGTRELARVCEMSAKAVRGRLMEATGHGIGWWRRMSRVRRLVIALVASRDKVEQCAFRSGYSNSQQAARDCSLLLSMSPTRVREVAGAGSHF